MPHGSIVWVGDLLCQTLALPSPRDFIPVIPKYILCDEGSWGKGLIRLCRLLESYTPENVDRASRAVMKRYDPLYGAYMPYVELNLANTIISPMEALATLFSTGKPEWALNMIERVLSSGALKRGIMGVTGSVAAGTYMESSDLDLVAFVESPYSAASIIEAFASLGRPEISRITYTGLLNAEARVAWRRRLLNGRRITLVIATLAPGSHCRPLNDYWSIEPPKGYFKSVVSIEGGQESALIYPPCVESRDGRYIISFEYNLGLELYEGGLFRVEGPSSESYVFIGVRESHSILKRV